jgi:hypothetical protein
MFNSKDEPNFEATGQRTSTEGGGEHKKNDSILVNMSQHLQSSNNQNNKVVSRPYNQSNK